MMKYWFELMSLYQFFTQNPNFKPKSSQNLPQNQILAKFSKNQIFIKIGQPAGAAQGGGTGRRPLKYGFEFSVWRH